MTYTIKTVAKLSGVSTRTLRYYDEISLLKPAMINSSGYRLYGDEEINRLQQILYYRELNFSLEEIKLILDNPNFDIKKALQIQYQQLLSRKERIENLLLNIKKTMQYYQGEIDMTASDKFSAFKVQQITQNEQQYGDEIRSKYGTDQVDQANKKYLRLTQADMDEIKLVEKQLFEQLAAYVSKPNLQGEIAHEIFELHKLWLSFTLPEYSADMHKGIVTMYVEDERFKMYYDEKEPGSAEALYQIIHHYVS